MLEFIKLGGPVMYPLLACSIIALAIILERCFYFIKTKNNNFKMFKRIELMVNDGEITRAAHELKSEKGPIARILAAGLARYGQPREIVEEYIRVAGEEEVHRLERNLNILETIATITPLLGLLGTVLGIINNFKILSFTVGITAPAELSSGIATALICTAFGLVIAIPSIIAYSYFAGVVESNAKEMSKWAVEFIDLLSQRGEKKYV